MYTCHCASPVKVLIIPTVKNTQNGCTHNCERLSNVFRGVSLTTFLEPEVVLKYVSLTTIISGIEFRLQPNASFCGNTCIYTAKMTYQKKTLQLRNAVGPTHTLNVRATLAKLDIPLAPLFEFLRSSFLKQRYTCERAL